MPLLIRPEREADFPLIHDLVRDAFASLPQSEGDEQDFVAAMREHAGYIPELALVAERKGSLIGYVMLTETRVEGPEGGEPVLLLAPLCVAPNKQSRGVGAALMHEAFRRAGAMGYDAVFLAGNPKYYHRFGFHSTVSFGIGHSMPVPDKYIMARELSPGALAARRGTILLTGHTTCASAMGASPKKQPAANPACC